MAAPELFIYYRVAAADERGVCAAVRELQAELRQRFNGLQAGLLRRPAEPAGEVTLMETYALADQAGASIAALRAAIDDGAHSFASRLAGARHVEVFERCA